MIPQRLDTGNIEIPTEGPILKISEKQDYYIHKGSVKVDEKEDPDYIPKENEGNNLKFMTPSIRINKSKQFSFHGHPNMKDSNKVKKLETKPMEI